MRRPRLLRTPTSWLLIASLAAITVLGCKTAPPPPPPPKIDFRAELRPHGQWLVVAPYGRVWHPSPDEVGKDFVPYLTNGQWTYGAKGWEFDSRFRWGDLVFHHGRWIYVEGLDWNWVEDETWGPAFVNWKVGTEYVGWAPITPEVKTGSPPPPAPFVYVKARYFAQPEIDRYRLAGDDYGKAISQSSDLVPKPGAPKGPPAELVAAQGGLESDGKKGYTVPNLPPPGSVPAVEVPPPPAPAPAEEPPPPPPKKKKHSTKKKSTSSSTSSSSGN